MGYRFANSLVLFRLEGDIKRRESLSGWGGDNLKPPLLPTYCQIRDFRYRITLTGT